MTNAETSGTGATQIRQRLDSLARALRAKDVDGVMEHYAPATVAFDITPPMRVDGAHAYRKNFEAWFASVEGPLGYELRDLRITMSGDIALCHYLGHVNGIRTNGKKPGYWVRVTTCFEEQNGQWMIIHEHVSMPFNPETMEAAVDLQP